MKYTIVLILLFSLISFNLAESEIKTEESDEKDWCPEIEEYFVEHCPIERGDYNGCCLCTQYYYYGCECCRDVVEEIGVLGDCSKWGEPTGHDDFCECCREVVEEIGVLGDCSKWGEPT